MSRRPHQTDGPPGLGQVKGPGSVRFAAFGRQIERCQGSVPGVGHVEFGRVLEGLSE